MGLRGLWPYPSAYPDRERRIPYASLSDTQGGGNRYVSVPYRTRIGILYGNGAHIEISE